MFLKINIVEFCILGKVIGSLVEVFPTLVCNPGWTLFEGSCYKHFETKLNWTYAQEFCQENESKLTEPHTNSTIEYVKVLATERSHDTWLGIMRSGKDADIFVWSSVYKDITLSAWGDNEPNNEWLDENCVEMKAYFVFTWNDDRCEKENAFICETLAHSSEVTNVKVEVGKTVIFICPVYEPLPVDLLDVKWKKTLANLDGMTCLYDDSSFGDKIQSKLKLESVQLVDEGIYSCNLQALTGIRTYTYNLTVTDGESSCPCPCEDTSKQAINKSREDLIQELQPELLKLQNDLKVNKTNLSSQRRRKTSAKDGRKSSQAIGCLGAACIVFVMCMIVLLDMVNLH